MTAAIALAQLNPSPWAGTLRSVDLTGHAGWLKEQLP
jgi:hypothetical protein